VRSFVQSGRALDELCHVLDGNWRYMMATAGIFCDAKHRGLKYFISLKASVRLPVAGRLSGLGECVYKLDYLFGE
jgi:hypothetical protein